MGSSPQPPGPNAASFHTDRLAPHFRIHSLTVFVSDMDRSLRFYLDQLGFNLLFDIHISIGRWVAVAPPDGTAMLVRLNPEPDSQEYKLIDRSRNVVLVAEDVVANFQEWSKHGVRFNRPPQTQTWGGVATGFEDPDGNYLALVGYDAATRGNAALHKNWKLPKQVQVKLFPQMLPHLPSLDCAGICIQARQVGGD